MLGRKGYSRREVARGLVELERRGLIKIEKPHRNPLKTLYSMPDREEIERALDELGVPPLGGSA